MLCLATFQRVAYSFGLFGLSRTLVGDNRHFCRTRIPVASAQAPAIPKIAILEIPGKDRKVLETSQKGRDAIRCYIYLHNISLGRETTFYPLRGVISLHPPKAGSPRTQHISLFWTSITQIPGAYREGKQGMTLFLAANQCTRRMTRGQNDHIVVCENAPAC